MQAPLTRCSVLWGGEWNPVWRIKSKCVTTSFGPWHLANTFDEVRFCSGWNILWGRRYELLCGLKVGFSRRAQPLQHVHFGAAVNSGQGRVGLNIQGVTGECARLRENVPYIKVHRSNPKHLYSKLNGYGDNGERKVWSSCGSTYCTCFACCYSYTAHVRPSVAQPSQAHSAFIINRCHSYSEM